VDPEPLMPSVRDLHRSFSAGEITPELFGRIDLSKRVEGLARCLNFMTLPHGPAINRPGTQFVREVKSSATATRIIPFSYNNIQTFIIELGAGYFRWHTNAATLSYSNGAAYAGGTTYAKGAIVLSVGINYYSLQDGNTGHTPASNPTWWYAMPTNPNIYEIPNPFAAADLFDIHFVQSADVLTLVHPNYAPLELRRLGATNWQTSNPSFTAPANSITSMSWAKSSGGVIPGPTASIDYAYVVTTIAANTLEESVPSATQGPYGFSTAPAGSYLQVTITDSTPTANSRYYVYKKVSLSDTLSPTNGFYGFIGQAQKDPDLNTYKFTDNNIAPDISRTPPIADSNAAFNTSGNYPGAVSYFQQRRVFAGSTNDPQRFWATRTGTESNMTYNIPVTSDNRINVRIAAREASTIRHIVPAGQLLLLTASAEWRVSAAGDVLTPAAINLTPQSYVGASNVAPVVVNNIVLYAAARGGHVRELSYAWQANSFVSGDICLMAPHLFDAYTLTDMCYSRGPVPALWTISSSGKLLGMTYVPEQEIAAWHEHDSAASGLYESCAVITENNEDMLYVIVNRQINGGTKRYVERLHSKLFATLADAFYVDAGLTYSGAPATVISGLTHLEGQAVNVLADGLVVSGKVVSGGSITLSVAASKVTVGLPITAQLQTPPLVAQVDGAFAQGRQMNINKAMARVYQSAAMKAGQTFTASDLQAVPGFTAGTLTTGMVNLDAVGPTWNSDGQICIQHTDPVPLDIVSLSLEVAIGG
jgi:hypothetical protein